MSRRFELARKKDKETGEFLDEPAFPDVKMPEYSSPKAAGADFFCAKTVTIPSIWSQVLGRILHFGSCEVVIEGKNTSNIVPTLVHTGIKVCMEDDEVFELYNRSGNPGKKGLILANGVGVVDADYYNSDNNDGEILFAFYNIFPWDVTISEGDKIGQGVFKKFLRAENAKISGVERTGGFGSTGK